VGLRLGSRRLEDLWWRCKWGVGGHLGERNGSAEAVDLLYSLYLRYMCIGVRVCH
jgi:hypothetical protein